MYCIFLHVIALYWDQDGTSLKKIILKQSIHCGLNWEDLKHYPSPTAPDIFIPVILHQFTPSHSGIMVLP